MYSFQMQFFATHADIILFILQKQYLNLVAWNRTLQGTDGDLVLKRYVNVNCLEHQATKFYAVVVVLLSEVVKGHKRPFPFSLCQVTSIDIIRIQSKSQQCCDVIRSTSRQFSAFRCFTRRLINVLNCRVKDGKYLQKIISCFWYNSQKLVWIQLVFIEFTEENPEHTQ